MKELLMSVGFLANKELEKSYEEFPKFVSPHEGYAVIKEEIEEHLDDTIGINSQFSALWENVKCNESAIDDANKLSILAIHAAAEAIQVAAMAQKYIDSLGGESHA